MKTFDQLKPGDKIYLYIDQKIYSATISKIKEKIGLLEDYVHFYYNDVNHWSVLKDDMKYSSCPCLNIFASIEAIIDHLHETI